MAQRTKHVLGAISTTSFSRLRGYTLRIMGLLRFGGSMSSRQLAEELQRNRRFVVVYLNRLRKYGLALKQDGFWFLSDYGTYLSSLLCREREMREIREIRERESIYRDNRRITQGIQKDNSSQPRRPFQVSIQAWLRDSSPTHAEGVVVDLLVKHYNETGSKFILVGDHYAMSDTLSISVDAVTAALSKLRQDNVVYLMKDPTSGNWKLGLKKAFVEALEKAPP